MQNESTTNLQMMASQFGLVRLFMSRRRWALIIGDSDDRLRCHYYCYYGSNSATTLLTNRNLQLLA